MRWWYPSHKQEEVAKVFQSLENPTGSVGETTVFAYTGSEKGIVGMIFTKVTGEKVGEALADAATILNNYGKIEGYEGNIEVWGDLTEVPET